MKYKAWIFLQLLVMVICCSCGPTAMQTESAGDLPEGDAMAATDYAMAATESAMTATKSAVFMNSGTSVKETRLANDFIRVWEHESGWMQENLDGRNRRKIDRILEPEGKESFDDVEWLTNDWIYYITYWEDDGMDCERIYRAPVEYDTGEAVINESKREKLFQGDCVENFMVTASYIFYSALGTKGEEYYYRYDLETGKKEKVFSFQLYSEPENYPKSLEVIYQYDSISCRADLPVVTEESFFLIERKGKEEQQSLYRVSLETLERRKIADVPSNPGMQFALEQDGTIYFWQEVAMENGEGENIKYAGSLWQYDEEQDEIIPVLDREDLQKIVLSLNLWEEDAKEIWGDINRMYIDDSKMYLQVNLYWYQEELAEDGMLEGEMIERGYSRGVLLSADFPDLGDWKLEKGLADYFLEHMEHRKRNGEWGGYISYSCQEEVLIEEVKDGQVLFAYDYRNDGDRRSIALYDLATGEVQQLPETDYRCMQ